MVAMSDYETPPESAPAPILEEEEEEEPPPPKTETPRQTKKRIRRNGSVPSRTVPKNDAGYPIVTGGPDPDAITTGGNRDEDGIGSV